jgi:hypothetical protein
MAAAVPFMMIAAAGISAATAVRQGQIAKASGNYNATINEQNAQITREETQMLARQHDREMLQRLGAIKAAQGKAGGAAGEGSVLDVLGDVAAQGELERQNIEYRGELKARGFQNTAALDRAAGRAANQGSYLRAGAELFAGAADYGASGRRVTQLNRT